jgi:superfamily II DNA or RNA helicase
LGRLSIRPRVYQFVPLLMALRLDPVRLLIADDVGVGKTIEALLIARELWDRGEIRRLCVLCPPYLCEQWQKELAEKFNLEAVVIRAGTVSQLERHKPPSRSLYLHYPVQVLSIDWVKSDRNRHQFLLHCPEFVIVDEAHGAARATSQSQQQRHALVRALADDPSRHLILLTATPHSGIPEAFTSLLGLLRPEFAAWEVSRLDEPQRIALARHFVQRTRKDIEHDWDGEHCFPERELLDESYELSPAYAELFQRTYEFCGELVRTGAQLGARQRRVRYWGALALLRCVMSSPAAALAALQARHERLPEGEDEVDFRGFVFESPDEPGNDEQPTPPVEAAEATLADAERRRLRELARLAARLSSDDQDTKLAGCARLVARLLDEDFHPIVWCRYVATAAYVADGLRKRLARSHPRAQVVCVTGRQAEEERRALIDAIDVAAPRVLVATDCLSEGINLQETFTAALHYDLPWNPNRLEQREGRVVRYGQTARRVRTIRYFGRDNPVDGVVLEVLLNKAREIHRALGTHVPVPEASDSVTEAVLNALFLRGRRPEPDQLLLDLELPEVQDLHRRWQVDAERERLTRTRFAQRGLKPDEVRRELEAADAVLGDPDAVRHFVLAAAQRLGLAIEADGGGRDVFRIAIAADATRELPDAVRQALPTRKDGHWLVSFVSPTPAGADYLGRNHRFAAALARYLMEEALARHGEARAARCGVIRTGAVARLTVLLLLRVRYLIETPGGAPQLAEEARAMGLTPTAGTPDSGAAAFSWLADEDALRLLAEAVPEANVPMAEKRELVAAALQRWSDIEPALAPHLVARARALEQSHTRLRQAVSLRVRELAVRPQLPPDVLGLLVLQPVVGASGVESGE